MKKETSIKKVVLVEPKSSILDFFSFVKIPLLGLPILGAILKKMGLEVKIFCERLAPIDWQKVSQADLVGISVLTNLAPRAYEIARKIKKIAQETKRKILIVMGGPHVSFLPEEALLKGADFVVRHEGEETFKELIEYLQGKGNKALNEILGLSFKEGEKIHHNPQRPFLENLDHLPPPDFSLIEGFERANVLSIQTSRGCPYDCEFCSVVKMYGKKIRQKSPEKVIEEIKELEKFGLKKHLFFVDDNFSALPQTLFLLEEMARQKIKLDWSTQERISVAQKKENLKLMRKTGCVRLCIGMESFNPEALKEWKKGQTPQDLKEGISILHQHGFLLHGMFIFGADADTPKTIAETIKLVFSYKIDTFQPFVLVPPPGTKIYERFLKEGRIFDFNWEHYDGEHVVFRPKRMSPWELQKLTFEAYQKFYSFRQGVKWALKGKFRNSFFAFYGKKFFNRWLRENEDFLLNLKKKWEGL